VTLHFQSQETLILASGRDACIPLVQIALYFTTLPTHYIGKMQWQMASIIILEQVTVDIVMQYQSMIRALQWTISHGRFDICTAIANDFVTFLYCSVTRAH